MKQMMIIKLIKKLKLFAVIALLSFVFVGALAIWPGIFIFNHITSSAPQMFQSSIIKNHIENLKAELKALPRFQFAKCWSKTQTLLEVLPWLEKSSLDNLSDLKANCFD